MRDGDEPQERDRELVDRFRAAHYPVVETVQQALTSFFHSEAVGLTQDRAPITSRLKTPQAIIAKLCRSTTNLSTMQDIAGARIVLPEGGKANLQLQDATFQVLQGAVFGRSWTVVRTKDQRDPPDPIGYRPLHVVVSVDGLLAEIQIRTRHQDRWAQIVEAVDGTLGLDLKHGRGPADLLAWLLRLSDALRQGDLGHPVELPPLPAPGGTR